MSLRSDRGRALGSTAVERSSVERPTPVVPPPVSIARPLPDRRAALYASRTFLYRPATFRPSMTEPKPSLSRDLTHVPRARPSRPDR
ncbi:MAG TPA: hypothetical protein DCQ98_20835 [Planctomycetaceae bacterium]|nr:hypothetical protein [Planctomycetaceae bacterium]